MRIAKITGLAFLSLLVVGLFPEARQALKWCYASSVDNAEDYAGYLESWPNGPHASEAEMRIEDLKWQSASLADKAEDYAKYLAEWPNGRYASEAEMRVEDLTWQQSRKTIRALRAYLHENPRGRFAAQVPVRESELRMDETPYLASLHEGAVTAIEKFLIDFPGHAKEEDAKRILNDVKVGRDIVDLLDEKSIEVHAIGSGIKSVGIRVRKLVSHPVTIRIPVGTYFVSANPSTQNMVTTAEVLFTPTKSWRIVSPPAACANMGKEIPSNKEILTLQRSSNQKDLAVLMSFLARSNVDSNTCQAAVWIVTDDARFRDLSQLVQVSPGRLPIFGSVLIGDTEAAQAMKICEEAGFDIMKKRIWSDRHHILKRLGEGAVKRWLEEKN